MIRPTSLILLLMSTMLNLLIASAGIADVILLDGMANPNYTIFHINSSSTSNPDDSSFGEITGASVGGNPGSQLRLTHTHDVQRDGNNAPLNGNGEAFLQTFITKQAFSYAPSNSGAIADISFSVDINFPVSNGPTAFQQIFFTIADQNSGRAAGFTNITGQAGWQTISVNGLTNLDFPSLNFSGSLPLSFGFGFLSSGNVTAGSDSLFMGIDNFQVSVTAVPEPGSLLLVMTVAIACTNQYRNRKRG